MRNGIGNDGYSPWRKEMNMLAEQQFERPVSRQEIGETPDTQKIQADQELNLKGKICPYTFVESMLALEEMETGEVLRVIVDYPPSACDVPKSLTKEGYEILDVSKINETDWAIVVRNTAFEEE
jgi:tRNA 2-thiouridine synthesizing protein A